ncbi:MAG: glycosyl hydrolase family 18 protein [Treponema sp.]|nr:glycosyl hydrolase family 18 protein [Treponema sp.]
MKKFLIPLLLLTGFLCFAQNTEPKAKYKLKEPTGEPVSFKENWGFVSKERLSEYNKSMPVTDVCLFSATINSYGELVDVPSRKIIDTGTARCHLVITCDSKSLSHFVLDPNYNLRKKLIKDIVAAAKNFDGVNIDFELIPARDRNNFITFLADLRYSLGQEKWFSVCVPARFKLLQEDMYPYAKIASYCDRVFIMAYDQHWSTSAPGPIADYEWCQKIIDYAIKAIPAKKLVMGIPFYGRTWADKSPAGAWYFSGVNRVMRENDVAKVTYENDIPTFTYKTEVNVTGYFNDTYSVLKFCRMYKDAGIQKVGFWRIGQEDPDFWNWFQIKK